MIDLLDCEIQLFDDQGWALTPKVITTKLSIENQHNCHQLEMEIMPFCPEQENGIYFLNQVLYQQFDAKDNYWIYIDGYSWSNIIYNLTVKSMSVDCQGRNLIYSYYLAGL